MIERDCFTWSTATGREAILEPIKSQVKQHLIPSDHLSFYRALSRQIIGDPKEYLHVLNAVLEHYIRILNLAYSRGEGELGDRKRNSLEKLYWSYEKSERFSEQYPFFQMLASPDRYLCTCAPTADSQAVLDVVTNALNIRATVWSEDALQYSSGPVTSPEYHVRVSSQHRRCHHHFESLIEDHSGKCLIEHMLAEQVEQQKLAEGLQIKRVMWYDTSSEQKPRCYNENRTDNMSDPPNISHDLSSLTIFTISVSQPRHIYEALALLDEALRRAPAQELPRGKQDSATVRNIKRYVAVDAEFKKLRLDDQTLEQAKHGKPSAEQECIENSQEEELCSVLTVAVDRHVVFSFYVLAMLQDPDANRETVDALRVLFEKLIFNAELIKLWFNYQSDIRVLDRTTAHMYQGTPRCRYQDFVYHQGTLKDITPTWKLSNIHFNGKRPGSLTFPLSQQHCALHGRRRVDGQTHIGLSPEGFSCPCAQTGNVDITTILDFILRQLGFAKTQFEVDQETPSRHNYLSRSWDSPRPYCNYGIFLRWTLYGDRLYNLLDKLNGFPKGPDGRATAEQKHAFYQSLGPGLEMEDDKIGYNAGDVIGVALLMRFLTTTDARKSLIARLMSYGLGPQDWSDVCLWQDSLKSNSTTPRLSSLSLDATSGIALVDDYPRTWQRQRVGDIKVPKALSDTADRYTDDSPPEVDEGQRFLVADFFDSHVDGTQMMSYYEHHKRALTARESYFEAVVDPQSEARYSLRSRTDLQYRARRVAHQKLFDPLRFELPDLMTSRSSAVQQDPVLAYTRGTVVPAGATYLENLYAEIMDEACRGYIGSPPSRGKPPRGFRVRPRCQQGHVKWPGESMELDGTDLNINDAFKIAPEVSKLYDKTCLDDESYKLKMRDVYNMRKPHARRLFGSAVQWKDDDAFVNHPRLDDILDPTGIEYRRNLFDGPLW